jgi:hypothetical protein
LGRPRDDDENIQPVIAMTGLTHESPTSSRWLLFRFAHPQGPALAECQCMPWRGGDNVFCFRKHLLALRDHWDIQRQKGRNCIAYAWRFDQSLRKRDVFYGTFRRTAKQRAPRICRLRDANPAPQALGNHGKEFLMVQKNRTGCFRANGTCTKCNSEHRTTFGVPYSA